MTIVRMLLFATIFSVLLALVGAAVGFGIGALISYVADISCFEGGCAMFEVTMAFLGGLVGAVVGTGLGFWVGWRSGQPVSPPRAAPSGR